MRATRVGIILAASLTIAPLVARAAQEESLDSHATAPRTTIVLDKGVVQPSKVTAERNNALQFENHSTLPMVVPFVEPADAVERVHCHFVRQSEREEPKASWQLFSLQGGKLTATIPPGKVASLCSFDSG